MSSPDSFTVELDITPVPVLDVVTEARRNFPTPEPARLSPDSTQTMCADLDPSTQVEGGQDDEGSLGMGPQATPTGSAEAGGEEVLPVDSNNVSRGRSRAPSSSCPSNAGSHANSECSGEGGAYCRCCDRCGNHFNDSCAFQDLYLRCATHATRCQACHESINRCECDPLPIPPPQCSNIVAGTCGPHPVLINNILAAINAATAHTQGEEPLHFREPKKQQRDKAKRGPLWRYALEGEETAEDRRHAEEEELALLEHHTPIMWHTLHDFRMSSGPMFCPDTSPSTSGTMGEK